MLADFYNVEAADPDLADDYTANKAKYATTPAAMAGFQHLQDGPRAGYLNKDFASAKFDRRRSRRSPPARARSTRC